MRRNFACVLRDAERNVVLDFLEKRDMATLKAYFAKKGVALCQQIEVVVSDMWDGYVNLVGAKGIFPNAINVIDRFHFVQHISTSLDGQRKLVRKEFASDERLKNLRWPLLKSPHSLNPDEQLQLNWGDYYLSNSMKERGLAFVFNAKGSPVEPTLQPVQS